MATTSEHIAQEKLESPPTYPDATSIDDSKPEQQDAATNTDLESASPEDDSAPPARWRTANIILLILAGLYSLSLLFTIIYTIEASTAFKCSHPGLTLCTQCNYLPLCVYAFMKVYELVVPLSVLPYGGLREIIAGLFCGLVIVIADVVFDVRYYRVGLTSTACGAGS